jgi:hypothetical protein
MKSFLVLVALAAFVAPYAVATHCKDPTLDRHTEEQRITDPTTGKLYYVEYDPCQTEGCPASFYLYEETNGFANLQRQDAVGDEADKWTQDDTCHGKIRPDTIVF